MPYIIAMICLVFALVGILAYDLTRPKRRFVPATRVERRREAREIRNRKRFDGKRTNLPLSYITKIMGARRRAEAK